MLMFQEKGNMIDVISLQTVGLLPFAVSSNVYYFPLLDK